MWGDGGGSAGPGCLGGVGLEIQSGPRLLLPLLHALLLGPLLVVGGSQSHGGRTDVGGHTQEGCKRLQSLWGRRDPGSPAASWLRTCQPA